MDYAQLHGSNQKPIPPRLRFETISVEDREATIASGIFTPKNEIHVNVASPGTKDEPQFVWGSWIKQKEIDAQNGRIPYEFIDNFKRMYQLYNEGSDIPDNGIPVRTSLMFSPAEQHQILNANLRTIEELAQANEDAIRAMGMGGRLYKERAKNALAMADQNKGALEIEKYQVALEQAIGELKDARAMIELYEAESKKNKRKAEAA